MCCFIEPSAPATVPSIPRSADVWPCRPKTVFRNVTLAQPAKPSGALEPTADDEFEESRRRGLKLRRRTVSLEVLLLLSVHFVVMLLVILLCLLIPYHCEVCVVVLLAVMFIASSFSLIWIHKSSPESTPCDNGDADSPCLNGGTCIFAANGGGLLR